MSTPDDFDKHKVYRAAAEIISLVYGLEDRFPHDELELFQHLRSAAVEVGARIAEGFARDGVDERGALSESTRKETRARLSELRHYVLTAQQLFLLDEHRFRAFEDLYRSIRSEVMP